MVRRQLSEMVFVGLAFVGCGNDGAAAHHDDASVGGALDGAIDAPAPLIDAPPPPADHYHYVIDKVSIPTTNTQARELGLDLNGDATVDNQLGMVFSVFGGMGFAPQASFDKEVDTGKSIMLADLYALDFMNAQAATFTMFPGTNPMPTACAGSQDTVCRHHLTGSASFTSNPQPFEQPLTGNFVNGTLAAGPGHLKIQLAFADAPPAQITLLGARVKLSSVSGSAITTAILAGGVTTSDLDNKVIPALQVSMMAGVTRDCPTATPPDCICMQSSAGQTSLGLFDANRDCVISVDELRTNSLIESLLSPDVTLENQQCLSIGIGAHAVPAGFFLP